MKKLITPIVLALVALVSTTNAQEGLYLNVYGAYNMSAAATTEFIPITVADSGTQAGLTWEYIWADYESNTTLVADTAVNNTTTSTAKINLGKGLDFGVAVGYMFNDHLGAELGIAYFIGGESSFKNEMRSSVIPPNEVVVSYNGTISATQMRFTPSLVVSTDFNDFVPYAKFGVTLGIATKITERYEDRTVADILRVQEWESKGGMALGASAAVGASYMFNKKTGIFLEVNATAMSYSPKERALSLFQINAGDALNDPFLNNSAKLIEYQSEVTGNELLPVDNTLSTLASKVNYPFTTFGLKLGLRFNF